MDSRDIAVTGAFGYLGRYIARILADRGRRMITLTGHPGRQNPFGEAVLPVPFHFDEPGRLVEDLRGVAVLFNTYWVRFNKGRTTYAGAVANSQNLIRAAAEAGVKRVVHISITNPSPDSPYEYFRGKAAIEETLRQSGLSYAIVRPTVLFGGEDILINNIAWLLRRMPAVGVFGRGRYRMQPVHVADVAELAVRLMDGTDNATVDATGPETYAYIDLVRMVAKKVDSRARILPMPPFAGWLAGIALRPLIGDVLVTRAEVGGLMDELLVSSRPPTCPTRFSTWLAEHAEQLGREYASELKRHY